MTDADWLSALRPLIDRTFRAGMLAAAEVVDDDAVAASIRALAADTGPAQTSART